MSTTFNEVAQLCNNSQSCFVSNTDILTWADQESAATLIPVDLVIAEWIAEGAWEAGSSAAVCNDPGNATHGTFSGCGSSYTTPGACSSFTSFYGASTATTGVSVMANIINAKYCSIAQAYANSSLTSGGQQLHDLAHSRGYTMLSNGTYNAAYAWGGSPWAVSEYKESFYVKSGGSTIPGSALILFIEQDGLSAMDFVSGY